MPTSNVLELLLQALRAGGSMSAAELHESIPENERPSLSTIRKHLAGALDSGLLGFNKVGANRVFSLKPTAIVMSDDPLDHVDEKEAHTEPILASLPPSELASLIAPASTGRGRVLVVDTEGAMSSKVDIKRMLQSAGINPHLFAEPIVHDWRDAKGVDLSKLANLLDAPRITIDPLFGHEFKRQNKQRKHERKIAPSRPEGFPRKDWFHMSRSDRRDSTMRWDTFYHARGPRAHTRLRGR